MKKMQELIKRYKYKFLLRQIKPKYTDTLVVHVAPNVICYT